MERTHPLHFSFDEGLDVGRDTGMPVYGDYTDPHGAFTATINWAQVDLGDDDHSHLVDPAEHFAAALRHR